MIKVVSVWGMGLAKLLMNPAPCCGPEQDSRMPREGKPFQEVIQGTQGSIRKLAPSFGSPSGDFSEALPRGDEDRRQETDQSRDLLGTRPKEGKRF